MHGPLKRAGGVAALEGVRTPSRVAREVMDQTDHHLLVGKGAQEFARNMGFTIEDDLNTPLSRKIWLEWKRRTDPEHYLDPKEREIAHGRGPPADGRARASSPARRCTGRSTATASTRRARSAASRRRAGLAFKIPGRVGDSPILGAGLYVDGAGRRGRLDRPRRGEPLQPVLVLHRRGHAPRHAPEGRRHGGPEAHQGEHGREAPAATRTAIPNFNINFYVLNAKGEFAGVAMYALRTDEKGWAGGRRAAACATRSATRRARGPIQVEGLLPGTPAGT